MSCLSNIAQDEKLDTQFFVKICKIRDEQRATKIEFSANQHRYASSQPQNPKLTRNKILQVKAKKSHPG